MTLHPSETAQAEQREGIERGVFGGKRIDGGKIGRSIITVDGCLPGAHGVQSGTVNTRDMEIPDIAPCRPMAEDHPERGSLTPPHEFWPSPWVGKTLSSCLASCFKSEKIFMYNYSAHTLGLTTHLYQFTNNRVLQSKENRPLKAAFFASTGLKYSPLFTLTMNHSTSFQNNDCVKCFTQQMRPLRHRKA